ncbi:cell division protein ZapE [Luminiphilus sp. nBUS_07]|uniref:cell division protein ZapE n=1 Tax=Luminiphilus sp. nBUS_07 TaxID=3395314 RepID=UPI003EBA693F
MQHFSPKQRYEQDLAKPGFQPDLAQAQAVDKLQGLYDRLIAQEAKPRGVAARLRRVFGEKSTPEQGLYFWGGVGRGKTYLVDVFYESLPFDAKLRVHFHRFMQRVHQELTVLAGEKNPLERVAAGIASEARVICFDEFFVSDIADAMILAGLMTALFQRGVTLVATSNIEPCDLYKDGLQRARFLPAIKLIETYTDVVNVDSGVDYRLRTLEQVELWHTPLNVESELALTGDFEALAVGMAPTSVILEINNRSITTRAMVEGMAIIDFHELCHQPRSSSDFIELARIFHTVLVPGIEVMRSHQEDVARRFVNMVDEFYDRGVKLIVTAETAAESLYDGNLLAFEFRRTLSRLQEMQSREYLAREHKP